MWLSPSFLYWREWEEGGLDLFEEALWQYAFSSALSLWVCQQTCSPELVGNSNSRAIWWALKPALFHALQYQPFNKNISFHLFLPNSYVHIFIGSDSGEGGYYLLASYTPPIVNYYLNDELDHFSFFLCPWPRGNKTQRGTPSTYCSSLPGLAPDRTCPLCKWSLHPKSRHQPLLSEVKK